MRTTETLPPVVPPGDGHPVRVLFVHNSPSRFVATDLDLLREKYEVHEWYQESRWVNICRLVRELRASDIVVGWFASWHTLFPAILSKIIRRPSVFVIGGYDTANLPEIRYGSQRGGIRRLVARLVIRLATHLITNSDYTTREAIECAGARREKISRVYHGIEPRHREDVRKGRLVITVGNVDRWNLQRKGLEPFVRAASLLPGVQFVVVGRWIDTAIDRLKSLAGPNVHFTGLVSDKELDRLYDEAGVYVQASLHEGFGLSLAEAMLARCVPVVSSAGALPEVVGATGIYLRSLSPQALADAICQALSLSPEFGDLARDRVLNEFPMDERRRSLYDVIEDALRTHKGLHALNQERVAS
jgi:glycosyltransferase involved in cell wall biosynthesis